MTMTALPSAPLPTDDNGTFNAKAFALLGALPGFVTEANATEAAIDADAAAALGHRNAAATSATASETSRLASASSADAAATSAGAVAWVSGTTYAVGAKVWSLINGRVHVRRVAGAGTTDPANDATNWEDVIGGQRIRITSATTLQVRKLYELDSSGGAFNVTLPASWSDQDWIDFVDVGMALNTNPVTVLRAGGHNIRRVAEDLILDVAGDSLRLVARTSLGWIEQ